MAYQHRLQESRYELKYIVDEAKARALREYVLLHLEPDDFCSSENGNGDGYPVNSLYLDSPALTLRQHTVEGLKNRFKLRIRFYDDDPDSPAFIEIKRRVTDIIVKQRAVLSRAGIPQLLNGQRPDRSFLLKLDAKSVAALENFCQLRDRLAATGSVFVSYFRDAYVAPGSNRVRTTFDRHVESRLYIPGDDLKMPESSLKPRIGGVIFEIKFTDRFPHWLREMAQTFGLQRCAMPKYVECVNVVRQQRAAAPGMGREVAR